MSARPRSCPRRSAPGTGTTRQAAAILQTRARTADGARERRNGRLLTDHALVQLFLDPQQFGHFLFLQRGDRDARPARDHVVDVLLVDQRGEILVILRLVILRRAAGIGGIDTVAVAVISVIARLRPGIPLLPAWRGRDVSALALDAQLHAGAGLVDHVDGFVGKEALREVAGRLIDRRLDRVLRVADVVVRLVAVFDPFDDLNGLQLVRRGDLDGLEPALQRTILLDRFAELGRRSRADALNLAARQGRLQDVRRVEAAFGRAGADQSV